MKSYLTSYYSPLTSCQIAFRFSAVSQLEVKLAVNQYYLGSNPNFGARK